MTARGLAAGVALAAALAAACRQPTAEAPAEEPWAEARRLVDDGRFDAAIDALESAADADGFYLLGRAWAGKSRSAPVPTPAPGSGLPAAALLKPEEVQALDFFRRAATAGPNHAKARLAIAELLAPHAVALAGRPGGGGVAGSDVSVERVLRAFADAVAADAGGTEAVEALVAFATATGQVKEADAAFAELARRKREDPAVLVRYGDFLAGRGGSPERALAQYAQALIWRPDDAATRLKMAAIHLEAAAKLVAQRQYSTAETRLRDARKLAVDPASAEAARLRELEGRLREIRGR